MTATPLLAEGARVRRREDLLTTEVDGELIAMSIERGSCYGLNRIGSRIWALIAEPRSIDTICAALLDQFEVTPETCRREVIELLDALRREDMIVVEPG